MRKLINIHADIDAGDKTPKNLSMECDDAIIISSTINGARLHAAANGDPSFTRNVNVWAGGFRQGPDLYTRLSQAVIQVITQTGDRKTAEYNLLNFLIFIIEHSVLKGKVSLHVKESLLSNTKEGAQDVKNA